jgi:MFS transporter, DHA1 family, tetracycline resistance protein
LPKMRLSENKQLRKRTAKLLPTVITAGQVVPATVGSVGSLGERDAIITVGSKMNRALAPILAIVALDAMGIGIVFPTLPALLRALLHGNQDIARHYGYLLAAYAATMLFASPILGILSDRFGRRPVLLLSLAGTAFDDLVMALAPTLSLLYLGRTLAGLTGANLTVANAYLADITTERGRATAFGRMNASFGLGFVAGPLLGGLAGTYSLRAPFYVAAAMNLIGALVCTFVLPETRRVSTELRQPFTLARINPFGSLRFLHGLQGVSRMLFVFCTIAMVGQVPSVLWVIYGTTRFGWSPAVVGLSFATFGLLHGLCQAFVPGPAQRWLGQTGTVAAGIAVDSIAFSIFSLVRSSAGAFRVIPLLSVGGVAEPAVQSMLTSSVTEHRQGELQGVLTSFVSLISIVGPIVVSALYEMLRRRLPSYPGSIWLFSALLYIPCVAVLISKLPPGVGPWRKQP